MSVLLRIFAAALLAALASPAFAIGFQYLSIPDDTGRSIEIGIWYPSNSPPAAISEGGIRETAALNGDVAGDNLPLVIFSHGSGGWFGDRSDTAAILANAGFVAVSMTYPGDNYKDSSDRAIQQMTSRPVVTSKVLDYVLDRWEAHSHLDASRIGFYGFSAGGFTGLVEMGGVPDWTLFAKHCAADPDEGVCRQGVAKFLSSPKAATLPASIWHHDPRIRAAFLASPGFGFAFAPTSLNEIRIPVELWGGEKDTIVQFETNAAYLSRNLPDVTGVQEVAGAQHYSFLRPCSAAVKAAHADICTDLPGFDRQLFQTRLNQALLAFFRARLIDRTP